MAGKSELPVLIGALLITGGLVATGAWWLTGRSAIKGDQSGNSPGIPAANQLALSFGDHALVANEGGPDPRFEQAKIAAVKALQADNAPEAVAQFSQALQIRRNAPETRIYFNNARIGTAPSRTIAVAVPLQSDRNGALEMLRGVAQAQSAINQAGGINNVPLKVAIVDDMGDPTVAVSIAQTLIQTPQILGVVGHYASDITLVTGKLYNDAGLVVISPVSTSVKLSNFGPYVLRTVPSDYIAARALADYSLKGLKRQKAVVFFNRQSGYSNSIKAEFASAMSLGGGTIVQEFDLMAADFSAPQALNQALDADLIFLAANTGSLDRALQVVQANQKRLPILGGDDLYAPKTLEVGGAQGAGMVVAVPWHIDASPDPNFPTQARQLWGAAVNWRTALAYDATQAIAAGIAQNPTRQGVQAALVRRDFTAPGAAGSVRFLPSGDRNAGIQLVQVVQGQKSGFGWDFVPLKAP